jgi:hypothetical protein
VSVYTAYCTDVDPFAVCGYIRSGYYDCRSEMDAFADHVYDFDAVVKLDSWSLKYVLATSTTCTQK